MGGEGRRGSGEKLGMSDKGNFLSRCGSRIFVMVRSHQNHLLPTVRLDCKNWVRHSLLPTGLSQSDRTVGSKSM